LDALTAAAATAVGCALGLASGLLPGVHVNTVCALALSMAPALGPTLAIGLCAMAVAHGFSSHLPSTYLGAPGEDSLLSALPAHRMLLEGRGTDAVRVALDGALGGLVLSTVLLLPYKWVLGEPGRLLEALDRLMPWVLASVLAFLLLRETPKGARVVAWSATIMVVSAALGLVAGQTPTKGLPPVPSSSLLPLLSGLFGAPALLETLRSRPVVPDQLPLTRPPAGVRRRSRMGVLSGVLAAALTSVLPGMTSSVAAAAARAGAREEPDPRPILATLSAIALSQVVLTFGVLWLSLRARSGLAAAVQQAWPMPVWTMGGPPLALSWLLLAGLASGLVAYVATAGLGGLASRWLVAIRPGLLAGGALLLLVATVGVLSGMMGLGLFAVATCVGCLPVATGCSRIHLTGCLLVPVLAYRLGLA
jgi:putative membrane protein